MKRMMSASLAVVGLMSLAPAAQAAVTVLGNGLSQVCFQTAEFGGNTKDGIAACNEALEQMALPIHDRAATYINRGILYARQDDVDSAMKDYDTGIGIDPAMGEGYIDRGALYIVLKRYDDALRDINKGISLNAQRLQIAYYDRAIVQEALGNVRAAYEDYKKATEIEPNFTLANQQLSRFKVIRTQTNGT
jgi:tetratricopeptide (TPR) repeat protein